MNAEKRYLQDMLQHFIQGDKVEAASVLNQYLELKTNRKINEGFTSAPVGKRKEA